VEMNPVSGLERVVPNVPRLCKVRDLLAE
jgi:hypothetical protein